MSDHDELPIYEDDAEELEFLTRQLSEVRLNDAPKIKPRPRKGKKHCADLWCTTELRVDSDYTYCFTHAKMFEIIDHIKNNKLFGDDGPNGYSPRNPFVKANNIDFNKKTDTYLNVIYSLTGIKSKKDETRETKITRLNMYKKRY